MVKVPTILTTRQQWFQCYHTRHTSREQLCCAWHSRTVEEWLALYVVSSTLTHTRKTKRYKFRYKREGKKNCNKRMLTMCTHKTKYEAPTPATSTRTFTCSYGS